jgi:hypothetical protein
LLQQAIILSSGENLIANTLLQSSFNIMGVIFVYSIEFIAKVEFIRETATNLWHADIAKYSIFD